MTLYVTEQGAKLSMRAGRLVVEKTEAILADLPVEQVLLQTKRQFCPSCLSIRNLVHPPSKMNFASTI